MGILKILENFFVVFWYKSFKNKRVRIKNDVKFQWGKEGKNGVSPLFSRVFLSQVIAGTSFSKDFDFF